MNLDRRLNRSEIVFEALNLQLQASLKRANFRSIILTEEKGFTVAGVGNVNDDEIVSGIAPRLTAGSPRWQGVIALDDNPQQKVTIATVNTEMGLLYLCGVGGDSLISAAELQYSCQGISRILA